MAVFIGELVGRYANDYIMNASIKRNNGVFEAESRLWYGMTNIELSHYLTVSWSNRACYIATPLYICGFITLGAAFQKHLGVGALVMGWGIAQVSIMVNTVAVYAYCSDAFPKHQVCKSFQLFWTLNRVVFFVGRSQCLDQSRTNARRWVIFTTYCHCRTN